MKKYAITGLLVLLIGVCTTYGEAELFEPSHVKKLHCYCAEICEYREAQLGDELIFVAHDPEGKHLYCQRWDYDNYDKRCKKDRDEEVAKRDEARMKVKD